MVGVRKLVEPRTWVVEVRNLAAAPRTLGSGRLEEVVEEVVGHILVVDRAHLDSSVVVVVVVAGMKAVAPVDNWLVGARVVHTRPAVVVAEVDTLELAGRKAAAVVPVERILLGKQVEVQRVNGLVSEESSQSRFHLLLRTLHKHPLRNPPDRIELVAQLC